MRVETLAVRDGGGRGRPEAMEIGFIDLGGGGPFEMPLNCLDGEGCLGSEMGFLEGIGEDVTEAAELTACLV